MPRYDTLGHGTSHFISLRDPKATERLYRARLSRSNCWGDLAVMILSANGIGLTYSNSFATSFPFIIPPSDSMNDNSFARLNSSDMRTKRKQSVNHLIISAHKGNHETLFALDALIHRTSTGRLLFIPLWPSLTWDPSYVDNVHYWTFVEVIYRSFDHSRKAYRRYRQSSYLIEFELWKYPRPCIFSQFCQLHQCFG